MTPLPRLRSLGPLTAVALALPVLSTPSAAQEAAARVTRIEAAPSRVEVERGDSAVVRIRALDASGVEVEGAEVRVVGARNALRWDDERGMVHGLDPGEHRLVATLVLPAGDKRTPPTVTIPVDVTWPAVTRVLLEPAEAGRPYAGTVIRYRARALHADGSERPDPEITWRTDDPSVATVSPTGFLTAIEPGTVTLVAAAAGVEGSVTLDVPPFPATRLTLEAEGGETARTGDVMRLRARATDDLGRTIGDIPLTWSTTFVSTDPSTTAPAAPAQVRDGRFVADLPGLHTVVATAGPLSARVTLQVEPRDVVEELEVTGHGLTTTYRTTDLWVFEGADGRDYALTGSKVADGHAFLFDVTDPATIVKIDSVQVNARTVNDVKVAPSGRWAALSREGASDRRNGVVILDLSEPSSPRGASVFGDGITGGVHNMFATDTHLFALSGGDKYVIIDVTDVDAPRYVSEYNHPDSRIHDVWVHDGIAYSAEWGTGVVVVDVGNGRWGGTLENPVFVTSFELPTGRTHAVFPWWSESAGKMYLFVGDEIMSRRGLAWAGYPRSMGSYSDRYDPDTGTGGIPLATTGYIQIVDFTNPENPEMVARYEVPEYGTHNLWVEDGRLYQAYYEGGLRVVDVSGELMGNLYTQGREIAVFKSAHPEGYTSNATMVWGAQPFKGHVFFSDTNSGLWAVRLIPRDRPIS